MILDLSGFMFSGKSSLSDLLREFDGIHVPSYQAEFDLLRVGGGLIDVHNAVSDWSPIRTHSALNRFEQVARNIGMPSNFPTKMISTSLGYELIYPGFLHHLSVFLKEVVDTEWMTPWPYDDLTDGKLETFARKVLGKFGINKMRVYRLTSPELFESTVQKFIFNVLTEGLKCEQGDIVITHNALEPFNPSRHLKLLGDSAKCITVDRDPRDIYATAVSFQQGYNDKVEFYKRVSGAHNVDIYIRRHNLYRAMVNRTKADNLLRLRFEDLVFSYEETLKKIGDFLELDMGNHRYKFKYFNPERSKENIGLWRQDSLKSFHSDFERIAVECQLCER